MSVLAVHAITATCISTRCAVYATCTTCNCACTCNLYRHTLRCVCIVPQLWASASCRPWSPSSAFNCGDQKGVVVGCRPDSWFNLSKQQTTTSFERHSYLQRLRIFNSGGGLSVAWCIGGVALYRSRAVQAAAGLRAWCGKAPY